MFSICCNFSIKINNHSERISKIKLFIDQCNWNEIDFPSTSKDRKKFELNNEIAPNILYVPPNTKKNTYYL